MYALMFCFRYLTMRKNIWVFAFFIQYIKTSLQLRNVTSSTAITSVILINIYMPIWNLYLTVFMTFSSGLWEVQLFKNSDGYTLQFFCGISRDLFLWTLTLSTWRQPVGEPLMRFRCTFQISPIKIYSKKSVIPVKSSSLIFQEVEKQTSFC